LATGRLALLVGLVAAGLAAILASEAGVTESELLFRAGLSFALFSLLTKAVAAAVLYLVPEIGRGGTGARAGARALTGPGKDSGGAAGGRAPAGPTVRGGRLDVKLPGTTADEVLNAGTGKEATGR